MLPADFVRMFNESGKNWPAWSRIIQLPDIRIIQLPDIRIIQLPNIRHDPSADTYRVSGYSTRLVASLMNIWH